jgi:hypothetical protein
VGIQARATDYNFDISAPSVTDPQAAPARTPAGASRTNPRPVESSAIPEFLQLLARAVQQYHTYPPTSPLCRTAIEACQRALLQIAREQLTFRVEPRDLIADELAIGRGTLIELELAKRLHAAAIAQVTIEQSVSLRELAHFAVDLIACSQRDRPDVGLIEVLLEHGVDRIGLRPACRPEVLPVREPETATTALLQLQRERREQVFAGGGPVDHLYPPGKGWVRLDPVSRLPSVSLVDLALLADSPASLAGMLVRLTDDEPAEGAEGEALSQKFSDVAMLFSALDPNVARVMFSRLARAVLDLETEQRQALLRKTILPSLLDGRIDGTVLRDFPDVDLAESLCLLLDLETAAPEVVTTALSRLDLSAEREAAVIPLVEGRLQNRPSSRPQDLGLDAHARRLVRIDQDRSRRFAEFAAFDLSLDEEAARTLADIRDRIAATDILLDQLTCLWRLARLEPNPELVQKFVAHAEPLIEDLQGQERWTLLADWLERFRQLAETLREPRPDVAEVIAGRLSAMCTSAQARTLVALAGRDDQGREAANRIIAALGAEIGPALLDALEPRGTESRDSHGRAAVQILCDHARLVAPALVARLAQVDASLARVIARVLGIAGAGYEAALGSLLDSRDEQTVREALRSLARIGTPQAATLVSAQVRRRRDWVSSAAEQTLWHFPPSEAQREVRSLLFTRDFVLHQPQVAARLLDRTAQQSGTSGLEPMLRSTAPLQYRFWNPSLMRLGRKAKSLLSQ